MESGRKLENSNSANTSVNGNSLHSRKLSGKERFNEMRNTSMKRLSTLAEKFTVRFDVSYSVTINMPSSVFGNAYKRCATYQRRACTNQSLDTKGLNFQCDFFSSLTLTILMLLLLLHGIVSRLVKKEQPAPKVIHKQILKGVKGVAVP